MGQQYAHGARLKVSSNSYANGANQNTGNFVTDRCTTRVAQPPGGSSSFSIGGYGGAPEPYKQQYQQPQQPQQQQQQQQQQPQQQYPQQQQQGSPGRTAMGQ